MVGRLGRLLVVTVLFCSCGWFGDEGEVEVTSDGTYLIIKNGLSFEIFYESAKEGALSNTWMPSFDHESIGAGERKSELYGSIYRGGPDSVVSGDKVVVYWWDNGYRGLDDLHAENITLK